MIIVNKPIELIEIKYYKCNSIWKMHPAQNMASEFITDCRLHQKEVTTQKKMENFIDD